MAKNKQLNRAAIEVDVSAGPAPNPVDKAQSQTRSKLEVAYHKDYTKNAFTWQRTRDAVAGEPVIKAKNDVYLPMPYAMQALPTPPSVQKAINQQDDNTILNRQWDPNYHPIAAYAAYKSRAQFPEMTQFILRGLVGLVGATAATIELPPAMKYLETKATPGGMSLHDLYLYTIIEVLITGRLTTVVDIDEVADLPILVPYSAESLINWQNIRATNSNKSEVKLAVFQEKIQSERQSIFAQPESVLHRVQCLRDGTYNVDVYINGKFEETIVPSYKGDTLDYIPSVCVGSVVNSFGVDPSPLGSIASSAVQIYMKNADLSNSEFMSCNPTLVMTGVDDNQTPQAIGATVCIKIGNPEAKVYYPITDTSALAHVLKHIETIYEQAIYQGAQLLDSSKKAAESAETTRLKQASSGATLVAVVMNSAKAMEKQLKIIAEWMGADPNAVKVTPETDFMSPTMNASEQTALIASWVAGAISHDTVLENFYSAGILKNGQSIEEEKKKVDEESKTRQQKLIDNMKAAQQAGPNAPGPNTPVKPGNKTSPAA